MNVRAVILLVLILPLTARGEDAARAQVSAATRDAVSNLMDEVSRAFVTRNTTVADILRKAGGYEELSKALQAAQLLGGPRWVDDHTCQVELQISGPRVGQALMRIVSSNPKESPVSPGELSRALKNWEDRVFSATGSATSAAPVARAKPRMGLARDPWANIPKSAREQAIAAAKVDAANRSLASVSPVVLTPKSSVRDVLAVKGVGEGMQQWFVSQPTTRVELLDDLRAEVELAATPAQAFTELRTLSVKVVRNDLPLPADDQGWEAAKADFVKRMATPVGRGVVPSENEVPDFTRRPMGLAGGARAPEWVSKRVEATASGKSKNKLLSARAAEASAQEKLVQIVYDVQHDNQPLGKLAKADKRVAEAIRRGISHARIAKTEYLEDGGAKVTVYLDLADVWQELRDIR